MAPLCFGWTASMFSQQIIGQTWTCSAETEITGRHPHQREISCQALTFLWLTDTSLPKAISPRAYPLKLLGYVILLTHPTASRNSLCLKHGSTFWNRENFLEREKHASLILYSQKAEDTASQTLWENSFFLLPFVEKGRKFETDVLHFTLEDTRFRVHTVGLACVLLLLIFWWYEYSAIIK